MLESFRVEMEADLAGASSSLAMLPTYLSPLAEGVEGTVAFVDAGEPIYGRVWPLLMRGVR